MSPRAHDVRIQIKDEKDRRIEIAEERADRAEAAAAAAEAGKASAEAGKASAEAEYLLQFLSSSLWSLCIYNVKVFQCF